MMACNVNEIFIHQELKIKTARKFEFIFITIVYRVTNMVQA